jgi:hypothetical protein
VTWDVQGQAWDEAILLGLVEPLDEAMSAGRKEQETSAGLAEPRDGLMSAGLVEPWHEATPAELVEQRDEAISVVLMKHWMATVGSVEKLVGATFAGTVKPWRWNSWLSWLSRACLQKRKCGPWSEGKGG